jgi:hypothetical protein
LPSGENFIDFIYLLDPSSIVTSFCDAMLHSLIVLSLLPEAKQLPSGENVTDLI